MKASAMELFLNRNMYIYLFFREQDIKKIKPAYSAKKYEIALDILKRTFESETNRISKIYNNSSLSRDKHLYLILECLWQLQNFEVTFFSMIDIICSM